MVGSSVASDPRIVEGFRAMTQTEMEEPRQSLGPTDELCRTVEVVTIPFVRRVFMKRALLAVLCGLVCAASAYADVRTEEKSQVTFEGMLGRMAGIFGGRAA